ncbi:MAG: DUF962 domain-containing protein [Acidobacteriota bacterium]|nr:DUF962 domain-containing protein [Acidobacteriota bacterium]
MADKIANFKDFYPYYLSEHEDRTCRRLHFIGSWLVLGCLAAAIFVDWRFILAAPFCGYGFAWVGHFAFEKNKPATFQYPLYSLMGDWVMFKDILTGRLTA